MWMIAIALILNFAVSWWNAYVCGQSWVESKFIGGFTRVLVWSAAIQSAIGFSSVYLFGIFGIGYLYHLWPPMVYQFAASFWYILVIIPVLGTGILITMQSWQAAYQARNIKSLSAATYNTLVMAHNVAQSVNGFGDALKVVGDGFSSVFGGNDQKSAQTYLVLLAIMLVVVALLAGALTTSILIKKYAGTVALPAQMKG